MPSVSDVAEAAEVSRATAYRYFPSQAAMVQAAVDEALGPILAWRSEVEATPASGSKELLAFAYPRMLEYEATHRAALSRRMDQWARRQAGTLGRRGARSCAATGAAAAGGAGAARGPLSTARL